MDIKTEYESIELDDAVKKEEFFEKLEDDGHWCDGETGLSNQSKKISKRRKKYQKIDNEIRLKIIEEVQKNGKLLKNVKIFLQSFPYEINRQLKNTMLTTLQQSQSFMYTGKKEESLRSHSKEELQKPYSI